MVRCIASRHPSQIQSYGTWRVRVLTVRLIGGWWQKDFEVMMVVNLPGSLEDPSMSQSQDLSSVDHVHCDSVVPPAC